MIFVVRSWNEAALSDADPPSQGYGAARCGMGNGRNFEEEDDDEEEYDSLLPWWASFGKKGCASDRRLNEGI